MLLDSSAINCSLQVGAQRKSKLPDFRPTFWLSKDTLLLQQNISQGLVFPITLAFFMRTAIITFTSTYELGLWSLKLSQGWDATQHHGAASPPKRPCVQVTQTACKGTLNPHCCTEAPYSL